ncbi:MAG TPA: hypothetical protein PK560_09495 [bacterium]|nr:hypothetical protein [bacterium]HQJ60146.1 hypothetical protein [bacterium]
MKLFILIIIMFFTFICHPAKIIVESVVANMNDRAITYSEILQEGELLNIESNVDPRTPLSAELKERILELIMFRIIVFEEARSEGVTIDESKIQEKVKTYLSNVYMKDFRKTYSISDLEFNTMIKIRLTADKMTEIFLDKKFKGKTPSKEEKQKAVTEWQKNLLKKQKLVLYSIP